MKTSCVVPHRHVRTEVTATVQVVGLAHYIPPFATLIVFVISITAM